MANTITPNAAFAAAECFRTQTVMIRQAVERLLQDVDDFQHDAPEHRDILERMRCDLQPALSCAKNAEIHAHALWRQTYTVEPRTQLEGGAA